jgi:hypothetical protein
MRAEIRRIVRQEVREAALAERRETRRQLKHLFAGLLKRQSIK